MFQKWIPTRFFLVNCVVQVTLIFGYNPNTTDFDGKPCSLRLPSRVVACPVYGVAMGNPALSQSALEAKCHNLLGFRTCPPLQLLLPNGQCGTCPASHPLQRESSGDLWCENSSGKVFAFINPMNCLNKWDTSQTYRPCYGQEEKSRPKVTIEHYYKGDDENERLTMQQCFQKHRNYDSNFFSHFSYKSWEAQYNFPILDGVARDTEHGFLACVKSKEPVSFGTSGWWVWYGIYLGGIGVILLFGVWKYAFEYWKYTLNSSPPTMQSIAEVRADEQIGYQNSLFGVVAFISLWALSIGFHVGLAFVALDAYGMFKYSLCDVDAVRNQCGDESWDSILGYKCASGCLISMKWTTGTNSHWPYQNAPGGLRALHFALIMVWVLGAIWWVLLRLFYERIWIFFKTRCELEEATAVMFKRPAIDDTRIEKDEHSFVRIVLRTVEKWRAAVFGEPCLLDCCAVHEQTDGANQVCRYIEHECRRYCWDKKSGMFKIYDTGSEMTQESLLVSNGLTTQESNDVRLRVGLNKIDIKVDNFVVALFREFFDVFYIYQIFMLWMWIGFYFYLTGVAYLAVILVSGCIRVIVKRRSQVVVKHMCEEQTVIQVTRDGQWVGVSNEELTPGDMIMVEAQKSIMCDCVLVSGRCLVDESSLTGEPTPVPKLAVAGGSTLYQRSAATSMKYTLLAGTYAQSVNCDEASKAPRAVVIATGAQTSQGNLVREVLFTPVISFKFDDHWKVTFVLLLFYGLVLFLISEALLDWQPVVFIYGVSTLCKILSPLIPAVFVAGQAKASSRIKKKGIFCTNLHRMFVAGKVKYFCFDKTGTLTEQGLEFIATRPLGSDDETSANLELQINRCMGCCHELTGSDGGVDQVSESTSVESKSKCWGVRKWTASDELPHCPADDTFSVVGNEVDRKMFLQSGFKLSVDGTSIHNGDQQFTILRKLEFDRQLMRMCVVIRDESSRECWVFCKGSYESVASVGKEVPKDYGSMSTQLANEGFYVLGMGCRKLEGDIEAPRAELEKDLDILGLLLFQNVLKADTPKVIDQLWKGDVIPTMITGDNPLTGMFIAKQAGIITTDRMILGEVNQYGDLTWTDCQSGETLKELVYESLQNGDAEICVSGAAFDVLCNRKALESSSISEVSRLLPYTRVFARMNPEEKVRCVRLHMEMGITGMCGDGANDAGALRASHCGVALSTAATNATKATIVAPFSVATTSLSVVPTLIGEGRNALATAMSGYKRLLLVGQSILGMNLIGHSFHTVPTQAWFITTGCFVNIIMSWAVIQSKPAKRLAPTRPTSKLLGLETILSIVIQFVINWFFVAMAIVALFRQEWFSCKAFDTALADNAKWWTKGDNYEGLVLSIVALFQVVNATASYNFGFEYRTSWIRNFWATICWLGFLVFAIVLTLDGPSWISCIFRMNCGDVSLLKNWAYNQHPPKINYPGDWINAPPGCGCDEQIGKKMSPTCENEYIHCTKDKYNQTYHHNIVPTSFRWILLMLCLINCAVSIAAEGFIMNGPVRYWFRRWRSRRQQKASE